MRKLLSTILSFPGLEFSSFKRIKSKFMEKMEEANTSKAFEVSAFSCFLPRNWGRLEGVLAMSRCKNSDFFGCQVFGLQPPISLVVWCEKKMTVLKEDEKWKSEGIEDQRRAKENVTPKINYLIRVLAISNVKTEIKSKFRTVVSVLSLQSLCSVFCWRRHLANVFNTIYRLHYSCNTSWTNGNIWNAFCARN